MASSIFLLTGSVLPLRSVVERKRLLFHTKKAGRGHDAPSKYMATPQCSLEASTSLVQRRSANYLPNMWDDSYIESLNTDDTEEEAFGHIKLKEDVRFLVINQQDFLQQLQLVDKLQQLGVSYHFENEIKDILTKIYTNYEYILSMAIQEDLCATSLLFRLLREHGFHISIDVFNNFKDKKGKFNASLSNVVKAMLSLYEASFLAIEGENQMDEARNFAVNNLRDLAKSLVDPLSKEHVAYALELPLHLRMKRLHTRWFINMYEREEDMNSMLLRLAKLDFNRLQNIYKSELKEVSRWWINQNIRENLGFARDRLVENYLWAVGGLFEPKFDRSRDAMAKGNCLITTIDDVYDVYGSLEELELFTDVVDRWDATAIEQLPDYMKICFMSLFNTINDIASKTLELKGVDTLPYFKRAWADLCKAYLVEARWYHGGYKPTFKEYMENAWITMSNHVVMTQAYCASEDLTKKSLECFNIYPEALYHSSYIFRLCDDFGTSRLERGDVPKALQCYMHEANVSEDVAHEQIKDILDSGWKKLNGDYVTNSPYAEAFKKGVINIVRMAHSMYQYGDGYADPCQHTKNNVIKMFIEPIQL